MTLEYISCSFEGKMHKQLEDLNIRTLGPILLSSPLESPLLLLLVSPHLGKVRCSFPIGAVVNKMVWAGQNSSATGMVAKHSVITGFLTHLLEAKGSKTEAISNRATDYSSGWGSLWKASVQSLSKAPNSPKPCSSYPWEGALNPQIPREMSAVWNSDN